MELGRPGSNAYRSLSIVGITSERRLEDFLRLRQESWGEKNGRSGRRSNELGYLFPA